MITSAKVADQALIAEISPAMMQKLRRDWRQNSVAFGLLFLLAGKYLLGQNATSMINETVFTVCGVSNLFFGGAFLIAAYFGRTLGVREELKFRRDNGKWRWER
jgi:uncharacterized membrane protein HdeD (DUF308 family)